MGRMLDLIRSSQVPSNLMQFAARGALSVPPEETIEILVHLALHNKLFSEQARLTLAGWDERASRAAAGNANTSPEVLKYLVSAENLRPSLLRALAENPAVEEDALDTLAVSGSREVIETLMTSRRVMKSRRLLEALQSNPALRPNEVEEIQKKLAGENLSAAAESRAEETAEEASEAEGADAEIESTVAKYLEENAAEVAAAADKPFQPIGLAHDEAALLERGESSPPSDTGETPVSPQISGNAVAGAAAKLATSAAGKLAAVAVKAKKHPVAAHEERRDSPLQRISKLDIRGRISLAMKGTKEDRSILVRDATKLVAIAVLESPKITEGEVEAFATQKNVLEAVLRAIPMKRRFAKNYNITRNLVQNPRTPLDLSLGLMKNLLVRDLKNLSGNKEVADTIRKVALRMYKQKMEKKG